MYRSRLSKSVPGLSDGSYKMEKKSLKYLFSPCLTSVKFFPGSAQSVKMSTADSIASSLLSLSSSLDCCSSVLVRVRLHYQPLFEKGVRAPPPNSLFGKEHRPDTRERRKSSLSTSHFFKNIFKWHTNRHFEICFQFLRARLLIHVEITPAFCWRVCPG